jgi:hypothetical protein
MESQSRGVIYVRKERRLEASGYRACFDYFFKVQGHEFQMASVGITESWHDAIPSLGKALTDDDLVAIAKEFLELELANGWAPSPGKNRVDISNRAMEHRVHNGSFSG